MYCPSCGALDTKVVDSRVVDDGTSVRRRRRCPDCGARFTTFERLEETPLLVVKSTGEREPFDRSKVVRGIAQASKGRPIDAGEIERIAGDVEDSVRLGGAEVTSSAIGLLVLEALARVDQVAYLRFASVYKDFDDADDFRRELVLLARHAELAEPVDGPA